MGMGKQMLRILGMGVKDGVSVFTIVMFAEISKNAIHHYSPTPFFKPESQKHKTPLLKSAEEKASSQTRPRP